MSLVRDIVCDRELFHVEEGCTVADVARRMAELHVGAIVVMNDGRLSGIFSERDIMKRVVLDRRNPESTPVEHVMSTAVVTIEELATLEDAMEMMQAHKCRHLPVTRNSRVVGFLSMRDLMNYELARKTEELHHMHAYVHGSA
jgi:CBS domain-containing protein